MSNKRFYILMGVVTLAALLIYDLIRLYFWIIVMCGR